MHDVSLCVANKTTTKVTTFYVSQKNVYYLFIKCDSLWLTPLLVLQEFSVE